MTGTVTIVLAAARHTRTKAVGGSLRAVARLLPAIYVCSGLTMGSSGAEASDASAPEAVRIAAERLLAADWAGDSVRAAVECLLKSVESVAPQLPDHYRGDLRDAVVSRLTRLGEYGKSCASSRYADLSTAKRILEIGENVSLLPHRPLPKSPADRSKAKLQYRDIMDLLERHLRSQALHIHKNAVLRIRGVLLPILDRVRGDILQRGFAQPLTDKERDAIEDVLKRTVDRIAQRSKGSDGVQWTSNDQTAIHEIVKSSGQRLRTVLKAKEGDPPRVYIARMKGWFAENKDLRKQIDGQFDAAMADELRLRHEQTMENMRRMKSRDR